MSVAASLRRFALRRHVRPWALSAPVLILILSIPLLRPLHTPDMSLYSDDESSRLATVQAIVEQHTLAIENTDFADTREKIFSRSESAAGEPPRARHQYSRQAPMLAALLSAPYWLMHRMGLTLTQEPSFAIFLLTLVGVTIPVAVASALVYRMSRIFEMHRSLRAALSFVAVVGSGLISYSTVLNAHAPAAVLLLASATLLIHIITHDQPIWATGWLALCGLCAAAAATIDPPAVVFLLLLLLVIGAFRWPWRRRAAGLALYCLGAALPLAVHMRLNVPITGDWRPGMFHPELAVTPPATNGMLLAEATREHLSSGAATASSHLPATQPADAALTPVLNESSTAFHTAEEPGAFSPPPPPAKAAAAPRHTRRHLTSLAVLIGDEDDDEPQTRWHAFLRGVYRVYSAFLGWHGIISHFPVMTIAILGVSLIMHRHWPAATKMLAGVTLGGALAVILAYALCRTTTRDAMFATRWFVVFCPLTLFWAGAWLRRAHRRSSWIMAGLLAAFSVAASILGATGPLPRDGFDRYTAAGAWHNLLHPPEPPPFPSALADRGSQDAFPQ